MIRHKTGIFIFVAQYKKIRLGKIMILPNYKCCQKLVPEDSARPKTLTLVYFIRRKVFVGGFNIRNSPNKLKLFILF